MICGRCGSSIADNSEICPSCGNVFVKNHTDLEDVQRKVKQELQDKEMVEQQRQAGQQAAQYAGQPMPKMQAQPQTAPVQNAAPQTAPVQPEPQAQTAPVQEAAPEPQAQTAQTIQEQAQQEIQQQMQAQQAEERDTSEDGTTLLAGGIFEQNVQPNTSESDTTVLSADALAGNMMPGEQDTTVLSAAELNANLAPSEQDTTLLSGSDFLRSPMGQEQMGNTVLRNENLTGPGPVNGYNSVVPGREKGPGISTGIMVLLISLGALALILIGVMVFLIIKLL